MRSSSSKKPSSSPSFPLSVCAGRADKNEQLLIVQVWSKLWPQYTPTSVVPPRTLWIQNNVSRIFPWKSLIAVRQVWDVTPRNKLLFIWLAADGKTRAGWADGIAARFSARKKYRFVHTIAAYSLNICSYGNPFAARGLWAVQAAVLRGKLPAAGWDDQIRSSRLQRSASRKVVKDPEWWHVFWCLSLGSWGAATCSPLLREVLQSLPLGPRAQGAAAPFSPARYRALVHSPQRETGRGPPFCLLSLPHSLGGMLCPAPGVHSWQQSFPLWSKARPYSGPVQPDEELGSARPLSEGSRSGAAALLATTFPSRVRVPAEGAGTPRNSPA